MSISKSIIKKNKGGVFLTALLGILSSLAMVFAGYSLSFLFGGYESSSDRMSQLIRDCITVFCIWVLALVVYYLFGIARANLLRTLKMICDRPSQKELFPLIMKSLLARILGIMYLG